MVNNKCALYARVSLAVRDEGDRRYQEPENQLQPLREFAKFKGYEVYQEYVDRGSGANPARSQFRQMMKDAMQLKFKDIIVWKMDRFSRESTAQVFSYIQKLRLRGVGIISTTESWMDSSKENPIADVILAVMSWASANEREKISQRTKIGIQRRKNLGIWRGGRPKGSKDRRPRKRGDPFSIL